MAEPVTQQQAVKKPDTAMVVLRNRKNGTEKKVIRVYARRKTETHPGTYEIIEL